MVATAAGAVRRSAPVLAAFLVACTGQLDGTRDGTSPPEGEERPRPTEEPSRGGGGKPAPPAAVACNDLAPAPGMLRHLTRTEYDNTIRDLLHDDSAPATAFPPDIEREGFAVGEAVSPLLFQSYLEAAERLAERARPRLSALLPCPASMGEGCARQFIERFGLRAYRRPLSTDEKARLLAVYQAGAATGGFEAGALAVIQGALSAPQFLYHTELDPNGASAGQRIAVQSYEMASRLSYFLWRSMPDETLFAEAAAGRLNTREQIGAQARRMWRDPRARRTVHDFHEQWLELGGLAALAKDTKLFPFFSSSSARALGESLTAFVDEVVWTRDGRIETLLTSPVVFVNAATAPFFGMTATGTSLRAQERPDERAGVLSHPALLALRSKPNQSNPVLRGTFVRERFLCQPLPPPPPDVDTTVPDPVPGQSTRARFARHSENPSCGGCHALIDPIGFGFEGYDAVGRVRARDEGGAPVDARGTVTGAGDADGAFTGVTGLARQLAASRTARHCVAEMVFRYALPALPSRTLACEAGALTGDRFEDVFLAVTTSAAFTSRAISTEASKP